MDIYAAALPGCPRLGAKHMRALMDYFETAEDVWKASAESVEKSHILTGKTLAAFLAYRNETSLEQIEEKLYRLDIRCSTFEDSDYPPLLATTANPPAVLFVAGRCPALNGRSLSSDREKRRHMGSRRHMNLPEDSPLTASRSFPAEHEGSTVHRIRVRWRADRRPWSCWRAVWTAYIHRRTAICSIR